MTTKVGTLIKSLNATLDILKEIREYSESGWLYNDSRAAERDITRLDKKLCKVVAKAIELIEEHDHDGP